jgi:nitroreductase
MNSGGMNSGGMNSGGVTAVPAMPPDPADAASVVLAAMAARYACKRFNPSRTVDEASRRAILEAGRLSPSSFGLEPWSFVIADTQALKDELYDACFEQENIRTASFVVTIAVRTSRHYAPDAEFVRRRAERFPGGLSVFLADYRGYWEHLRENALTEHWARSQGYIACANMMTVAAALGIDSCPIEGYREDAVRAALGLNEADWRISLLVPFGFRGEEEREKIREPYDSVVVSAHKPGLDHRNAYQLF